MSMLRTLTFASLSLGLAGIAAAAEPARPAAHESHHASGLRSSPLVEKVRQATKRYRDVNVAIAEDWVQGTPCVSGPNEGAMGVHYVLPARIGDGAVNAEEPEALIYEPLPGGALRLVGVEFIVLASDWEAAHPEGGTPSLDGHLLNYVGAPNRYGLPAFYEIHVWAWEANPKGSFADWNTRVTCERQPAN
jgi:hypothetical protein